MFLKTIYMKNLLIIIISILSISCSKNSGGSENNTFIDKDLNIYLKNSEGLNLLDSEFFPSQDFKVFYEINGQRILFNEPNLTHSKGFKIYDNSQSKILKLYLNDKLQTPVSNTYFQWSATQTDKITAFFDRKDNYVSVVKILLNDVQVWDASTSSGREITIIK